MLERVATAGAGVLAVDSVGARYMCKLDVDQLGEAVLATLGGWEVPLWTFPCQRLGYLPATLSEAARASLGPSEFGSAAAAGSQRGEGSVD